MRRRNTFASLAAAGAAMALVLSACAGDDGGDGEEASTGFEDCAENPNTCNSGEAQEGGEITWTLDVAPDGYFPWSPEGGSVYTVQAMHGILPYFGMFDPAGEYEYNLDVLAAEPEIINEDPLTTQWQIREEAVWDDGTPITANDAIIYWMMSTPEDDGYCVGCNPRDFEQKYESIEPTSDDGKTFTITYKDGVLDPEWFAFGSAHNLVSGIVPAHVGVEQGFIEGDDPTQWEPEGLGEYFEYLDSNPPEFSGGPYLIESFDLESEVVKVPNPSWYGEVKPTLERVVIRFLTDEDTWAPAIQNGELHGAAPFGWSEDVILQMQEQENVLLDMRPGPSWEHIDLNLDNEWLKDVELRRAIFTAVNRQELLDRNFGELFPDATLRNNHVFSQDSEFYVDQLEGTGQGTGDVELARQILEAAGYTGFDGEPGDLTLDGEAVGPLRLRSTTAPARETNAQLLQSQLGEIGIEIAIEPTEDLGGTLVGQDYDIMEFGWSGSPLFAGNGGQYWESTSGSNFGKYANDGLDALAEQERAVGTQQESADLHNQMMEILVPEAYVLPLYDTPVYMFVTDNYVNIRDNVNGSLRAVYNHHEWGVAAE